MRIFLILSLLIVCISCKKEKTLDNDMIGEKDNVRSEVLINEAHKNIEAKIKKIIPNTIPLCKQAMPKFASLNSEYFEYFDFEKNEMIRLNLNTNRKELDTLVSNREYYYLTFYKNTNKYKAMSYGEGGKSLTKIITNSEEIKFPNTSILDCFKNKIILTELQGEADTIFSFAEVYDIKTRTSKQLKVKTIHALFKDDNTLFLTERLPPNGESSDLIIYDLKTDLYKSLGKNIRVGKFLKYFKEENILYYLEKSLIYSYSLDSEQVNLVSEKYISSPLFFDSTLLMGYVYSEEKKSYDFVSIPLVRKY